MPVSATYVPILSQFIVLARNMTTHQPADGSHDTASKPLPKGVVLGKDGKPCRTCTDVASWMQMTKGNPSSAAPSPRASSTSSAAATRPYISEDCPPDVARLGRSTWTFLHSWAAVYPDRPSLLEQQQTRSFLSLFSNMYPCHVCADDFRSWMDKPGNAPRVSNRDEFGKWMCDAHNAVNEKLGKNKFDCGKWEERWATGPADGRCG